MFNKTLISGPLRAGSLLVSDILHWFRTLSRQAISLAKILGLHFSDSKCEWISFFCGGHYLVDLFLFHHLRQESMLWGLKGSSLDLFMMSGPVRPIGLPAGSPLLCLHACNKEVCHGLSMGAKCRWSNHSNFIECFDTDLERITLQELAIFYANLEWIPLQKLTI